MKKFCSIILIFALILVHTQALAATVWVDIGDNLFVDSDCSDVSIYESAGNVSVDSEVSKHGESSLKIENVWQSVNQKVLEAYGFDDELRLDSEKKYHASMYIKLNSDSAEQLPAQVQLVLNVNYDFERRGQKIPYSDSVKKTVSLTDTEDWQPVECYFTVPDLKTSSAYTFKNYSIAVYTLDAYEAVSLYVDEISFCEAEEQIEKYTNIILNPTCDTTEGYTTFWNCTMTADKSEKTEGNGSIRVQGNKVSDNDAATYPIYTQITEYLPGDSPLYFRVDTKGSKPGAILRFCFSIFDTEGNVLKNQLNVGKNMSDYVVSTDWHTYECTFTLNQLWSGYSAYTPEQIGKYEIYAFVIKQSESLKDNVWWFDDISLREVPENVGSCEIYMQGGIEDSVASDEPIVIKCSTDAQLKSSGNVSVNGKILAKDEYTVQISKEGTGCIFEIIPKLGWFNNTEYNVMINGLIYDVWGRNLSERMSIAFKTRSKVTLASPEISTKDGKTTVSITVTNNEKASIPVVLLAASCDGDYVEQAAWSDLRTISYGMPEKLTAELSQTDNPIRIIVLDDDTALRAYDDVITLE